MSEYRYCYLPSGNAADFPGIDEELIRRGVNAEMSIAKHGGRLYRIPVYDLDKMPKDDDGPYLGDDESGFSIYDSEKIWEEFRQCFCSNWKPVK